MMNFPAVANMTELQLQPSQMPGTSIKIVLLKQKTNNIVACFIYLQINGSTQKAIFTKKYANYHLTTFLLSYFNPVPILNVSL